MNTTLITVLAFAAGGLLAFAWMSARIRMKERERLEAVLMLEGERRLASEKEALMKKSEAELEDRFRLISANLLRENQESFLSLAKGQLEQQRLEGDGTLERREQSIRGLLDPMKVLLGDVKGRMDSIEKESQRTFTEVKEQFRFLKEDQTKLQQETANLVKALRAPQVRGQWGEIQLRRVVELAGMISHVDYVEQTSTETETGRLRPDMLVRLPGNKLIVIDAKTPLAAYLELVEAKDESQRKALLAEHGRQLKDHIAKLSAKAYWDQFPESPEFVVLFLPSEALYAAALEADPRLIESGTEKNVIIATPTTLITLLKAIAYGWSQERLAENAGRISLLGKELYDRMAVFVSHMDSLKKGLERSVEAYNKAAGTFESRILPSTRKFRDLGVSSDKEIPLLDDIERIPKEIHGAEEAP